MSSMNKQELIENNMRLVYYTVSHEYPTFIHDEDIIQSGMLGLCKAAENWDESKAKFSTYAVRCIRNEINQEFIKRKPHSKVLSLDVEYGENGTFGDTIVGQDDVGYLDNETFLRQLSEHEKKILQLDNQGYSTDEIADVVGCSVQKVQKTLRLIRLKWRNYDNGHFD